MPAGHRHDIYALCTAVPPQSRRQGIRQHANPSIGRLSSKRTATSSPLWTLRSTQQNPAEATRGSIPASRQYRYGPGRSKRPSRSTRQQHSGSIPTAANRKQRLGRSTRQYHPRRTGQKHPSRTSPRAATSTPTLTPPPSHHEVPMPVTARQRCPRDASPHRSHASIGPKPPLVVADRSHPSRRGRAFCLLSDLSRSPLRVGTLHPRS